MLYYYFCSNTLSDMPIHTSLHTTSCLVVARSLHCSIHLPKYSTHVPYIQFIPQSDCHTLHQVLPNNFFSPTSLNFKCMKIWVPCFFYQVQVTHNFGPQLSSHIQKVNHLNQVFSHRPWKYNITIMYFLTIKCLHFSPNTLCEQFWGLKKRTCPGKGKHMVALL